MYVQITDKCNMVCEHCGFSCSPLNSQFMKPLIFNKALKSPFCDEYLTIGGGEPTLHPLFWDFVGMAMTEPSIDNITVITNGSMEEDTLKLLKLSQSRGELLSVSVSLDEFHDDTMVSGEVSKFVYEYEKRNFNPYIRSVNKIIPQGRGKNVAGYDFVDDCICPDLFITPKGDIKFCGCEDSPIICNIEELDYVNTLDEFYNKYEFADHCHKELEELGKIGDEYAVAKI